MLKKTQNIRAAFIVEVGKDQLYTVFQVDAEFFFNSNHMKIQVYKIGIQLNQTLANIPEYMYMYIGLSVFRKIALQKFKSYSHNFSK